KELYELDKEKAIAALKEMNLTPKESSELLLEASKQWWKGKAELSVEEQEKAAELGALLRERFGAVYTPESERLVQANKLMLAAKRDYWVAVLHMDTQHMEAAKQAMRQAERDGASIPSGTTKLDEKNLELLKEKITYYENIGSGTSSKAEGIRAEAEAAGALPYVLANDNKANNTYMLPVNGAPGSSTKSGTSQLDRLLSELYELKKDKWNNEETSRNPSVPSSVQAEAIKHKQEIVQKGIEIRKQLSNVLDRLDEEVKVADSWVIDEKNQQVLDAAEKIKQYEQSGDIKAGQREYDLALKLLKEG
ncbi:hypothetical protein, partial [Paenibacillus turpanensis]|uniref:hypothetical protein n=1 Tax=Paenibacillus turpanensis TaxID=2689078 RepID=UPI001409D3FD